MLRSLRPIAGAVAVLLTVSSLPSPASALTKQEAAAAWVARVKVFMDVNADPTTTNENVLGRQRDACKGITGERMKMGGYWPLWAAEGMASYCKAMDGFQGAITVKDPCGELKKASGYFGKAKAFGDSDAVEPAAAQMVQVIEKMRGAARNAGLRRC